MLLYHKASHLHASGPFFRICLAKMHIKSWIFGRWVRFWCRLVPQLLPVLTMMIPAQTGVKEKCQFVPTTAKVLQSGNINRLDCTLCSNKSKSVLGRSLPLILIPWQQVPTRMLITWWLQHSCIWEKATRDNTLDITLWILSHNATVTQLLDGIRSSIQLPAIYHWKIKQCSCICEPSPLWSTSVVPKCFRGPRDGCLISKCQVVCL